MVRVLGLVATILLIAGILSLFAPPTTGLFLLPLVALALYTVTTLLASPTGIMLGHRNLVADALAVLGFLSLSLYTLADESLRWLAIGFVLVFLSAGIASRKPEVKRQSLLGAFKIKGGSSVAIGLLTAIMLFGLYVVLFHQALLWVMLFASSPIAVIVLSGVVLVMILSYTGYLEADWFFEAAEGAHQFVEKILRMFRDSETVLLGISGILILYYTFSSLLGLPWLWDHYAVAKNWMEISVITISGVGTLFLSIIPLYIWYKIFVIRMANSSEHLPDWPPWLISLSSAAILSVLILPVLTYVPSFFGVQLSAVETLGSPGHQTLALFSSSVLFLLWVVITYSDEFLKRVLMAGPFFASVLAFGVYVYKNFVTLFLDYANELFVFVAEGTYVAAAMIMVLFIVSVLFFVSGFLSFLYEVWRD